MLKKIVSICSAALLSVGVADHLAGGLCRRFVHRNIRRDWKSLLC